MSKLFHLVVTEPEVKGAFEKIRSETVKLFKDGSKFEGLKKTYKPNDEGGDKLPTEEKEVVTTVAERLNWTQRAVVDLLDYELTRDKANQSANADLEVDGTIIATAVPVSTLLTLEGRLKTIRDIYDLMPTLDFSKKWELNKLTNKWAHGPVTQYRTAKKTVPLVLYQATHEFPAQTKEVVEDVRIGEFETVFTSGAVSPLEKATRLVAIDKLISAVKRARMKANETDASAQKIGEAIFKYIHTMAPVL